MADPAVHVEGLRELRRDLKRLQPEVAKELTRELRQAAGQVAREAASHAPRRTGAYARSIKPYVTARGISVGSRLPQAGVLHWGGTIRPRGVPIHFRPRPVVSDAVERRADEIVDSVGDAVDRAARKVGWNRS